MLSLWGVTAYMVSQEKGRKRKRGKEKKKETFLMLAAVRYQQ